MLTKDEAIAQIEAATNQYEAFGSMWWSYVGIGEIEVDGVRESAEGKLFHAIGRFTSAALTAIDRTTGPDSAYSKQAHAAVDAFPQGSKKGADILAGVLATLQSDFSNGFLQPYDDTIEKIRLLETSQLKKKLALRNMAITCFLTYVFIFAFLYAASQVNIISQEDFTRKGIHLALISAIGFGWGGWFYPQHKKLLWTVGLVPAGLTIAQLFI